MSLYDIVQNVDICLLQIEFRKLWRSKQRLKRLGFQIVTLKNYPTEAGVKNESTFKSVDQSSSKNITILQRKQMNLSFSNN